MPKFTVGRAGRYKWAANGKAQYRLQRTVVFHYWVRFQTLNVVLTLELNCNVEGGSEMR